MTRDIEKLCIEVLGSKLGKSVAYKLVSKGINTIDELASMTLEYLESLLEGEVSRNVVRKLLEPAREKLGLNFVQAYELKEKEKNRVKFTTGSKALDELLKGGIELGCLYEFAGEFGSGKTQICHQLCVNVHLPPEKGGLETPENSVYAAYIDTEGTFRPERLIDMAKALEIDPQIVLQRTFVARAVSTDHQYWLIQRVREKIKEGFNIKLVIVDSITALFRAEYTGRGTLAERQQKLNRHIRELLRLCMEYNVAVVVTNQVMAKPDAVGSYLDMVMPVGGHVLAHAITYRILLRKAKGDKRIAKVMDAPDIPEMEVAFSITEDGIR